MNFVGIEIAFCLLLWYKDRSTNPFSLELNLELVSPTYLTTSMYNILIITIYKQSVHSRRNQGVPLTWFQSRRILSSLAWKLCTDRDRNCKTAIWRIFFFREKKIICFHSCLNTKDKNRRRRKKTKKKDCTHIEKEVLEGGRKSWITSFSYYLKHELRNLWWPLT